VTTLHVRSERGGEHLQRLRAIVDSSAEAILSKTAEGIITSWNPAATMLYGYTADEAIGRHISMLVPLDKRLELEQIMVSVASGRAVEHLETIRLTKKGDEREVELSVCPLFGQSGEIVGASTVAHDISERRRTERDRQWLVAIVESSVDAIASETPTGVITSWNRAAERLYGYRAEEVMGQNISIVVPSSRRQELAEIVDKVSTGSAVEALETVRVRKDGMELSVLLNVWPLFGSDGEVVGTSTVTHDITAEAWGARERRQAEARFQAIFRRSAFGMVTADLDGVMTVVNPAFCLLLGRGAEELVGSGWGQWANPDDAHIVATMLAEVHAGASYSGEQRFVSAMGEPLWLWVNVTVVHDDADEPVYFIAQVQDITDRKRVESELEHRALHDDLTGLPNRALLNDRLDQWLAVSRRAGWQVGVVFLDLDYFKHINDAMGHSVGDILLVEVGHRLNASVRPGDTVARFGGDEFVIVCNNVGVEPMTRLASRIADAVAVPFLIEDREIPVQASLGITLSRPGSTVASLLSEADAAMYRAKDLGRGRVSFFDDSLRTRAEVMVDRERALRLALKRNELVAHYQPIIDMATGDVVGVEALARWHVPGGLVIEPPDFIPLAEATGLIIELGREILESAVSEVATWNAEVPLGAPIWISVNLSARQLADTRLSAFVTDALRRNDLSPNLLHLEVTETVVIDDIAQVGAVLLELKALGVQFAIDDFGTGYSSFSYLNQLPVDCLKIERSFVAALGAGQGTSIVKAVLSLADALGLRCIAEGVETVSQRDALVGLGCRYGQGYLWSPPLSPSQARTWVKARKR
jgi:diguanylate cyclase (GGDEF)-like protein/PAS domain S-box-containing protein